MYPGDPTLFHSSLIVRVLTSEISAAELINAGRLASVVNKSVLLATVGQSDQSISYLTVEWDSTQ